MKTAGAALILALLLSTTICKGEENSDQEKKDGSATANLCSVVGIFLVIDSVCIILNEIGILDFCERQIFKTTCFFGFNAIDYKIIYYVCYI